MWISCPPTENKIQSADPVTISPWCFVQTLLGQQEEEEDSQRSQRAAIEKVCTLAQVLDVRNCKSPYL